MDGRPAPAEPGGNGTFLRSALAVAALVLAAGEIGACSVGGIDLASKTCTTDRSCGAGLVCFEGACSACAADLDADPANCGWCSHGCGGESACSGGVCASSPVVQGYDVSSMAVDEGTIYFTAGSVYAYSILQGGTPTPLPDAGDGTSIAARAPWVAWCYDPPGSGLGGGLSTALEKGGQVAYTWNAFSPATCVTVNSTSVYWWSALTYSAYMAPLDGGNSVPLLPLLQAHHGCVSVNDEFAAVLIDTELAFYDPTSLAAPYDPTSSAAPLRMAPRKGETFDTDFVSLAGAQAYVLTQDDGGMRYLNVFAPDSGAGGSRLASFPRTTVKALVADSAGAFWADGSGQVYGCADSRCTGGSHRYARQSSVTALALDDAWVYAAGVDASSERAGIYRYRR